MDHEQELIQIDVAKVLDQKLGTKARWIPRALVRWLKGLIRQDDLNELLRRNYPKTGAEFCKGVFSDLDVTVDADIEALPPVEQKRMIVVSNHPLGGLDGMALIAMLSRRYGPGVKFLVNDLLMAVGPLCDVFLPINKHGAQSRSSLEAIDNAMRGDEPIVIFPAGLVSRRGRGGKIRDLEWQKMFVNKAVQHQRDVLPLYFSGQNSGQFYKIAQWRKRLGVKFNIEMLLLPREVFRSRGRTFTVKIGDPIPWQQLQSGKGAKAQAQKIKEKVYDL